MGFLLHLQEAGEQSPASFPRPSCESCGKPCRVHGRYVNGEPSFRKLCDRCNGTNKKNDERRRPWANFKKDKCEECGFIPKHSCQLDVDHMNGDKKDNALDNLKTLCANCHRLKTYQNKDWEH